MEKNTDNSALRYDGEKPGFEFLEWEELSQVNEVFRFGAKKYAPHNWKKGMDWHRCVNSCLRHLFKWFRGERYDEESGLPHLAHAAWNILALMWYEENRIGLDTRPITLKELKDG